MSGRWIIAGGVLVAAALALVAWQFLFAESGRPPIVAEEPAASPPDPAPLLPETIDVERASSESPATPTETVSRTPRTTGTAAPLTEWLIDGVIEGLSDDVPWTGAIVAVALPEAGLSGHRVRRTQPANLELRTRPNQQGRFRIPLSRLQTPPETTSVRLMADDPAYLPARTVVELPLVRGKLPAIPGVLPAVLRTGPAGGITGRVLGAGGLPRAGVPVAVFPPPTEDHRVPPEELPTETRETLDPSLEAACVTVAVDRSTTDHEGKYRLRIGESGNYVVVATGDRRPGLVHCPGTVYGESVAADLVQDDGQGIRGEVVASFGPVAAARLVLTQRSTAGNLLAIDDTLLRYQEGAVDYQRLAAVADEKGRFEFTGLSTLEYTLQVGSIPIAGAHPDLAARLRQDVTAPADGVLFNLIGTFVVFRVDSDPFVTTPFTVKAHRGSDACSATTNVYREAAMFLAPGETYDVVAEGPPFLPTRTSFHFPEDEKVGTQTLRMRLPPPGKLLLTLKGTDPSPTRARLTLTSEWGPTFDRLGTVPLQDGETVVSPLTPGTFHLTCAPMADGEPVPWLPLEARVTVLESQTTRCELNLVEGGFLEVAVEDVSRELRVWVSRDGELLPLRPTPSLVTRNTPLDDPSELVPFVWLAAGTHRLAPAMPAGPLTVSFEGEDGADQVEVNISAGATTRLRLPPDR